MSGNVISILNLSDLTIDVDHRANSDASPSYSLEEFGDILDARRSNLQIYTDLYVAVSRVRVERIEAAALLENDPDRRSELEEQARDLALEIELAEASMRSQEPGSGGISYLEQVYAATEYADLHDISIAEALELGAVYLDENGRPQAYSLEDGDPGDNNPGDGYAYDYTLDLSDDYDGWLQEQSTNNVNGGPLPSSPIPIPNPSYGGETQSGKPVILDLDGDGVEIAIDGDVSFDVDGDGFLERGSWVAPDDGFLVIDLNADGTRGAGDGVIDQARELGFALWGDAGDTDLQALRRAFDNNNDGLLNAQDSVWSELRVWQDLDQDGETDAGELRTLADWGITEINLGYDDGSAYADTSDDISIFGNTLHGL
ncbi:hypothetical protein, partial [Nioella sp. MMSF_3534]|uniref:hypothetical protein n=1 Tax=Nioella sp. MMSF_3534 TaxID=3046720 RepID=UPI00273EE9D9